MANSPKDFHWVIPFFFAIYSSPTLVHTETFPGLHPMETKKLHWGFPRSLLSFSRRLCLKPIEYSSAPPRSSRSQSYIHEFIKLIPRVWHQTSKTLESTSTAHSIIKSSFLASFRISSKLFLSNLVLFKSFTPYFVKYSASFETSLMSTINMFSGLISVVCISW